MNPLLCFCCGKRPVPAERLTTCSAECFRKLAKSERELARLDRQAPRENLGGIGS